MAASASVPNKRRPPTYLRNKSYWGMAFVLPTVLFFAIFYIFPIFSGFYLSLTDFNLLRPPRFVGLENFERLFSDRLFQRSVMVTLGFVFGSTVPVWIFSLLAAKLFFQRFPGREVLKLIFLSPLMLLTAFAIWRYDKGNVFFIQERMGLDGRPFPMVKFRSMRMDADKIANWTVENDPRITPIGRTMRKTNWDEIPQLFNVLLGHMSLVGPRPEQTEHVLRLRQKVPRYMERHREKAGMTGWAQIHGLRGDTSIEERVTYDLWYVENWSLWLDIKIILRTIIQTLTMRSRNAY